MSNAKEGEASTVLLDFIAEETGTPQPKPKRKSPTARRYEAVDAAWPKGELPRMTGREAISAARQLYRLVMEKAWPGRWKAGRGNHRTYPRGRVFLVNPGQGWKRMVHDLSHACFEIMLPEAKPHATGHAYIERQMIEYVVASGWLDGRLQAKARPAKPKPDVRTVRYERVLAGIRRWRSKAKRADTALKKLERQRRYYERQIAAT